MTNYLTETQIRSQIQASVESRARIRGQQVDQQAIDTWAAKVSDVYRRTGRLLTERQAADRRSGRRLQIGDRAVYIGETREEAVDSGKKMRRQGQIGTIIDVRSSDGGAFVSFHPFEADAVDLIVREGTPSYLLLERVE